jgi:CheY-like chemotaxis protein
VPGRLDGTRILVVDDNDDTRFLLTVILKMVGASVVAATSGRRALELHEAEPFDVIVSDIMMPELDGFDFIREIRARERGGAPRVLAVSITGLALDEIRDRSLASGYDAHVRRPIDTPILVETVRGLVRPSGEPPPAVPETD